MGCGCAGGLYHADDCKAPFWEVRDPDFKPIASAGVIQNPCKDDGCGCREVDAGLREAREKSLLGKADRPVKCMDHDPDLICARCSPRVGDIVPLAQLTKDQLRERCPNPDELNRKSFPIASGVLSYFPLALAQVAYCSKVGNDQHNPGEPLHWAREKSTDDADAAIRHFMAPETFDSDGVRHKAKAAWRMLAVLEKELEAAGWKLP